MEEIQKIAKKMSKIKGVDAVFLFGSYATGKNNALSDIDLCVFGKLSEKAKEEVLRFSSEKLDISLFDELPIWIKTRVFRDGKPLINKNEKKIREMVFRTMHEWEDFKPTLTKLVIERFGKCMT